MKRYLIILLLCFVFSGSALCQEMKIGRILDLYKQVSLKDRKAFDETIGGYAKGAETTNIIFRKQKGIRLWCKPEKLAMSNNQYAYLLSDYVDKNPEYKTRPMKQFPFVLVWALMDTFPCKK